MTSSSYTAEIDPPKPNAPCSCNGGCDWTGHAKDTVDIDDCVLTPGDGSPVGRCPKCGTLAYLDEPDHWSAAIAAKSADDAKDILRKRLNIAYNAKVEAQTNQIRWPNPTDTFARIAILTNWLQLTAITRSPRRSKCRA